MINTHLSTIAASTLPQQPGILSINDVSVAEGNAGTTTVDFTVTLSAPGFRDWDTLVDFTTANGTATVADNDYVPTSGTLTFPLGSGTVTMPVRITSNGDTRNEGNETFFVNLSNARTAPPGFVSIGDGQGVCTLLDDEAPPPPASANLAITMTAAPNTPSVGANFVYTLTVTNNGPSEASSVNVDDNLPSSLTFISCSATGGGLCSGTGNNRRVSFATLPSGASATVTLVTRVDCTPPDASPISNRATVISSITDPDYTNNAATVNSIVANPAQLDHNSQTFPAAGGSDRVDVTVGSNCNVTAMSNATWLTITFITGDTGSGFITYTVAANGGAPRSGTITIVGLTFTVTQQGEGLPELFISGASVREGDQGTRDLGFVVALSAPASQEVTFTFATVNLGTALALEDYNPKNLTVHIRANSREETVYVQIRGDTKAELDENFIVGISNATGAVITGKQATGIIIDDDLPALSINDVSIIEGHSGTKEAVFTISLNGLHQHPISFNVTTTNDTAIAGRDYTAISMLKSIRARETSTTVSVPILGDTESEDNETFFVNLINPLGASLADGRGIATILNDDGVTLSVNDIAVIVPLIADEEQPNYVGFATAFFSITKTGTNDADVTVNYTTVDDTATSFFLYQATSGTLRFPAGSGTTSKIIPIRINAISISEMSPPRWRFLLRLADATNATIADREGICTIEREAPTSLTCSLFPMNTSRRVYSTLSVTARVLFNNLPIEDAEVFFEVINLFGSTARLTEGPLKTTPNGTVQFSYFSGVPLSTDWIRASGTVNGLPFSSLATVMWLPTPEGEDDEEECLMAVFCVVCPGCCAGNRVMLQAAHGLRDNLMVKTPRGRSYTQLYYQFSPEAVGLVMTNPGLLLRLRDLLERYKPVIEALANRREATVSEGDIDELSNFLNYFGAKGSPQLRQSLEQVSRDLRAPQVQAEFGIRIVNANESMVIQKQQSLNRLKVQWSLLGVFGFFFIALRAKRQAIWSRLKPIAKPTLNLQPIAKLALILKRVAKRALILLLPFVCAMSLFAPSARLMRGTDFPEKATASLSPRNAESAFNLKNQFMLAPLKRLAPAARLARLHAYEKLPLRFEVNEGQADASVKFLSRNDGYNILLTPTETRLQLRIQDSGLGNEKIVAPAIETASRNPKVSSTKLATVAMKLIGAKRQPKISGLDQLPCKTNYLIGNEARAWRTNVSSYAKVQYEEVYKGVDFICYGNQGNFEYDFKVAPGADFKAIRLAFEGADEIEIDRQGDLILRLTDQEIRQHKPVVYQDLDGERREIASCYVLFDSKSSTGNSQQRTRNPMVGFQVADYDKTKPLIIDPVLTFSTFLGGKGDEESNAVALDANGNLYVIGFTDSPDFPLAAPKQPLPGGAQDVFVAKLNASGTGLTFATYLGGQGLDNGSGIAVDKADNIYITGFTGSDNFPVTNAFQSHLRGTFNAFVAKLNPSGSALVYSTYLGGTAGDFGSAIAVDGAGNAYLTGVTTSTDFPSVNPLQQTNGGVADVFAAKLNASGTQLFYSTYLGGTNNEGSAGIAIDTAGNAYLTGVTSSPNFPVTASVQPAFGGGAFDGFITKINAAGSRLVYSTYLGGAGDDHSFRIAVDAVGNAYVTGDTASLDFPLVNAMQKVYGGSTDAFLAKLNPTGSAFLYSTYLGGNGLDSGVAIALNAASDVFVTGYTASDNFPLASPFQSAKAGGSFDAFVLKLNAMGAALDYATYLGGRGVDAGIGIAVDKSGNAWVMGQTDSSDFPTVNPLQKNVGGAFDIFVAQIKFPPQIIGADVTGKKLVVFGSGFDNGAKILVNGQAQKTLNDALNPTTVLTANKAGKQITQTVTLQVRNADGAVSQEFRYTRPAQ